MYRCIRLSGSVCMGIAMLAAAAGVTLFGAVRSFGEESGAEADGIAVPIIMYHSVVKDASLAGEYIVTVDELEADIRGLLERGYTTVFCSEIADYAEGVEGAQLPEKPVALTFDDGCYNNFYYVLPLLEKYDVKATFAIVGEWCAQAAEEEQPSPVYSYMDSDNLRTLVLSGRCELANHGYEMHSLEGRRGMLPLGGESGEDYRRTLWGDLTSVKKLFEKCGQQTTDVLAYPYGFAEELTEELAAQLGYRVTLSCEERVNVVAVGDSGCTKMMGRFNRASGRDIFALIEADK